MVFTIYILIMFLNPTCHILICSANVELFNFCTEYYITLNPQVSVVMRSQISKNQALRQVNHSIALVNETNV